MAPVVFGASANVQVTFDNNPDFDRSESALSANPQNPLNMVGSSKRFTDPRQYDFTLAAYSTFDGGSTWQEAAPLTFQDEWTGISDPTVA